MNLTIDAGLAALFGAAIAVLGSFLTQWLQGKREEKLWKLNQQAEQQQWARDRLHEAYTNALHHLTLILRDSPQFGGVEWSENYIQAQKWLNLVLLYSPTLGQGQRDLFVEVLKEFVNAGRGLPNRELVGRMRQATLHLAQRDNAALPGESQRSTGTQIPLSPAPPPR